jgi:putative two-component system response regulator
VFLLKTAEFWPGTIPAIWGDMLHANPARVLVVDDSPRQVEVLERALTRDGYECLSISRGDLAIDLALSARPDVILLDVELPGMDGLSVCRLLKACPETRLIPVLVITGGGGHERHLQALEAGADDFLPKPVTHAELRARVRSAVRLKKYIDELDNASAALITLGATIEARDRHTRGHCERLADYGTRLGRRLGLGGEDLLALGHGGFLHDLGKIAIPDAILFKPGPLTEEELTVIRTHPEIGERICLPLHTLDRVRPIIRHHHEQLNGSGYPDGLKGSAVPLLAQIVSIADIYDALTTDRPYRHALTSQEAFAILEREAREGKRDLALVMQFITEITANSLEKLVPCHV